MFASAEPMFEQQWHHSSIPITLREEWSTKLQRRVQEDELWKQGVHEFKLDAGLVKPVKAMKLPKKVDVAGLNRIAPPRGQVWESVTDQRCRGFLTIRGVRHSKSADFSVWGAERALLLCFQWLWQTYCDQTGEKCPVLGLLEMAL